MKKFLLASLICLTLSISEENIKGPAYNSKNGGLYSVTDYYVLDKDGEWLDDTASGTSFPGGVSDCVDYNCGIQIEENILFFVVMLDFKLMELCMLDVLV